jgi:ribonuclease Z
MRPRFYPSLANDRFGDPAVFVDFLMERRAVLFDLGDISGLAARSLLRVSDVFVSHAHIDHFIGFDHLLRLMVGRDRKIRLYGPAGFIERIESKLNAYTWNLVDRFDADLVIEATEKIGGRKGRKAVFRLKNRFEREAERACSFDHGVILHEDSLRVTAAELAHRTPCLAFCLEENAHLNIWKSRLEELGLSVGPWLRDLKSAIHAGLPDETPISVNTGSSAAATRPLGLLREKIVSVTRGQKIAYVTDAAFTRDNANAIVQLAAGADVLFIEAMFARDDADTARDRAHLTTEQAGRLARQAGVARVVPFHFSSRYAGHADMLSMQVDRAFRSET